MLQKLFGSLGPTTRAAAASTRGGSSQVGSLDGQVCMLVGGIGVTGRGLARGLLQAGATVVVNSRHVERLRRLREDLAYPDNLLTINGSLLPHGASATVQRTLEKTGGQLDHVIAHQSVRWLAGPSACDELQIEPSAAQTSWELMHGHCGNILDLTPNEFMRASTASLNLHFSAAQQLVPRLHGAPDFFFPTLCAARHAAPAASLPAHGACFFLVCRWQPRARTRLSTAAPGRRGSGRRCRR